MPKSLLCPCHFNNSYLGAKWIRKTYLVFQPMLEQVYGNAATIAEEEREEAPPPIGDPRKKYGSAHAPAHAGGSSEEEQSSDDDGPALQAMETGEDATLRRN